jgi:hypothetical protein
MAPQHHLVVYAGTLVNQIEMRVEQAQTNDDRAEESRTHGQGTAADD